MALILLHENSRGEQGEKLVLVKSPAAFQIVSVPVIQRSITVSWQLRVFFTEDVFASGNSVLLDALADDTPRKVLVVLDDALAQAQPQLEGKIRNYFTAAAGKLSLVRPPLDVPGGEGAKNSQTLVANLHEQFHRHHLDRQAYLVVIGGGALLDVAGFAAATAHRGLRLVRLPTTTLSQANSGVGVKNGLNAFGQKNFIGTFAPPFAVINDASFLRTLPAEEKRNGYVEAVKIACLRDEKFFDELERDAEKLAAFEAVTLQRLIHRSAELHLNHLADGGDPFERGPARPPDLGCWAAHKLEQLSNFHISHGQAVAIGIALDVLYARDTALLAGTDAERILHLLEQLGFKLFTDELLNADDAGRLTLLSGLEEFREHCGGKLSITLLTAIGHSVAVHQLNPQKIIAAIEELRRRK